MQPRPHHQTSAAEPADSVDGTGSGARRRPVLLLVASGLLVAALVTLLVGSGGFAALVDGEDEPAGDEEAECRVDPATMTAPGCDLLRADTASVEDPVSGLWGALDCAETSRHEWVEDGGDESAAADGNPQEDDAFRRLTVLDGDDVFGERCELGRNDHLEGETAPGEEAGTFALFREGEWKLTFVSYRLPPSFPLEATSWQAITQMKQTQPATNGNGTPVIELNVQGGRWRLIQSGAPSYSTETRELWSAPAARGRWTRFAFEVHYSQDPASGSIRVYADLDGDGDFEGEGERSPELKTYTLKSESEPGAGGLSPGDSIPSHLRVGIYHDPAIECGSGCAIELDNIQVLGPAS